MGHVSPEAAAGGVIGLIEDGDRVVIDVASRALTLDVADDVLAERRAKMEAVGAAVAAAATATGRCRRRCAPTRRWRPARTREPSAASPDGP